MPVRSCDPQGPSKANSVPHDYRAHCFDHPQSVLSPSLPIRGGPGVPERLASAPLGTQGAKALSIPLIVRAGPGVPLRTTSLIRHRHAFCIPGSWSMSAAVVDDVSGSDSVQSSSGSSPMRTSSGTPSLTPSTPKSAPEVFEMGPSAGSSAHMQPLTGREGSPLFSQ